MPSPREKKIEVGERMLLSGAHYPFIYLFIYFFFFFKKALLHVLSFSANKARPMGVSEGISFFSLPGFAENMQHGGRRRSGYIFQNEKQCKFTH